MHLPPKLTLRRSPTCVTQAPVLHNVVPQSVLQAVSYIDLDSLDRSVYQCVMCDILRSSLCVDQFWSPTASLGCSFNGRLESERENDENWKNGDSQHHEAQAPNLSRIECGQYLYGAPTIRACEGTCTS